MTSSAPIQLDLGGTTVMTSQTHRSRPAAYTRTSASLSLGTGWSMSPSSRTSSPPYRSWTMAFMVAQLNAPRPSSCVVHIALGEGEVMDHEAVRQLLVHQASEQPAGGALTRVPSSLG